MGAALSMSRKRRRLANQTLPPPHAQEAEVLPKELMMEILSWLSVKTLMPFKCVSKTWNSLIFDPTFVKLHLQRSPKNTHILLSWFEDECTEMKPCGAVGVASCSISRLLENPSSTIDDCCHKFDHSHHIVGVCNGLVCFRHIEDQECWFQFWNPATKIMSEDSPRLDLKLGNYNLGQLSMHSGFGFDDWSDTYKVVMIICDDKSHICSVKVHCLGDTCWKSVLTFLTFPALYIRASSNSQFVSGTLNYLAHRNTSSNNQQENVIFSYVIGKEKCRYLSVPDDLSCVHILTFGVLKGCLCLCRDDRKTHMVIWLMREFGVAKSWTRLFNISYECQTHVFSRPYKVMPLCISENEEDVALLIRDDSARDDSKLVFYNRRDNRIHHTEYHLGCKCAWISYEHVESLVLPYGNCDVLHLPKLE